MPGQARGNIQNILQESLVKDGNPLLLRAGWSTGKQKFWGWATCLSVNLDKWVPQHQSFPVLSVIEEKVNQGKLKSFYSTFFPKWEEGNPIFQEQRREYWWIKEANSSLVVQHSSFLPSYTLLPRSIKNSCWLMIASHNWKHEGSVQAWVDPKLQIMVLGICLSPCLGASFHCVDFTLRLVFFMWWDDIQWHLQGEIVC